MNRSLRHTLPLLVLLGLSLGVQGCAALGPAATIAAHVMQAGQHVKSTADSLGRATDAYD
jgi:hypothetical protein